MRLCRTPHTWMKHSAYQPIDQYVHAYMSYLNSVKKDFYDENVDHPKLCENLVHIFCYWFNLADY